MIKEAIEKILELRECKIIEVDGREYSTNSLNPIRPLVCDTLQIHTLSGLVEWLKEGGEPVPMMLQIQDEVTVRALGDLWEDWRVREMFVQCTDFKYKQFNFGTFMSIDRFIIELQSKFVRNDNLNALLKVVASIATEEVLTSDDDGVSQTVVKKNVAGRLAHGKIEPIVRLAPYRTFRDAIQPESDFLLRLEKGDGLPRVALFEADGGAWRNKAIKNIAAYLKASATDIRIIS